MNVTAKHLTMKLSHAGWQGGVFLHLLEPCSVLAYGMATCKHDSDIRPCDLPREKVENQPVFHVQSRECRKEMPEADTKTNPSLLHGEGA